MSVVGLIVEYNPFHNGHIYHLEQSKHITNSKYSVAVMSGNFLQRGEPALTDKWSRAKMAIDSGVDLVLELPFIYASSSAEYFSDGAVKLLDSLNIVEHLSFGSEVGKLDVLNKIVDVILDEPKFFKDYLREYLDLGLSFPKSRSLAVKEFLKFQNYKDYQQVEEILSSPNNILAIEYMKSLRKINSSIEPHTIERYKSRYHDKNITSSISSATSIRQDYFENKNLDNIRNVVPEATYHYMNNFLENHSTFNNLDLYNQIFLYYFRLVSYDKISYVMDVEDGLHNRIKKSFETSNDLSTILKQIDTKRYPLTKIKRILIHSIMNLDKDTFKRLDLGGPRYIRVLASSKNGLELLNQIKVKSNLPIITKFSNYSGLNDELLNEMIDFDKKATDLYFTALSGFTKKPNMNLDFFTSPYIFKK